MISHENRILSYTMMGVETPIPPIEMDAVAPGGAPPRRLQFPVFPQTELAPPCRKEALRQRSPRKGDSEDFHGLGVNLIGSCAFPQNTFFVSLFKSAP
jgi:hypothetical protein